MGFVFQRFGCHTTIGCSVSFCFDSDMSADARQPIASRLPPAVPAVLCVYPDAGLVAAAAAVYSWCRTGDVVINTRPRQLVVLDSVHGYGLVCEVCSVCVGVCLWFFSSAPSLQLLINMGRTSQTFSSSVSHTTRTSTMLASSKQIDALFTSEMNANKKLFGKDLREYENMDMDDLLDQLTPEEIDILTREVDPDDSLMPPDQRTAYRCEKKATGPLDRKQLIDYIHEQALNDPDRPEMVPFQAGTIRGKKWVAPTSEKSDHRTDEEIALDLDDEYESALGDATENELVDLAAILGFHSMMNQDQYHASLLGKKMEGEVGWGGITRASRPKPLAPEPPNLTDPEQSIDRLKRDDPQLKQLNFNNIKNISDEQLARLFEAAAGNTHMESLLMSNTGLCDRHVDKLVDLLEANSTITEVSLESNFISPIMMSRLVKALLKNKSVETFRAANQRSQVLGNKIEMEITKYVEQNTNLLQLGLHFDFNDARARISAQLQKNRDRFRLARLSARTT